MKEAGRTIKDTIMDLNYLQAGIHTKESTLTGKHTAKVFILGLMAGITLDSLHLV